MGDSDRFEVAVAVAAQKRSIIFCDILLLMGAITIKIPQKTNRTFEITDRKTADKIIREVRSLAVPRKKAKLSSLDFSGLSALADKYERNPDADMLKVLKTAEKLRTEWRG